MREKCSNTEFFLVRIQSKYKKIRTRKSSVCGHSVFSPNTGKYGPEKALYVNFFQAVANLEFLECENAQKYSKKELGGSAPDAMNV